MEHDDAPHGWWQGVVVSVTRRTSRRRPKSPVRTEVGVDETGRWPEA